MPRKEDIEKFKEVLNSLGGEPEIMARRSQSIDDVRAPDDAIPPDLGELLGTAGGPGESSGEPSAASAEEPLAEPDFGLDLSSLDEGVGEAAQAGAPAEEQAEEPQTEEAGLDFGSLFGEEGAVPSIEDIQPPAQEAPGEEAQPEGLAAEELSLPETESPSMQSDISQMEVLPEDIGEPPAPDAGEAPSPEEGGESFDLSSLSLEGLGDIEVPAESATSEEGASSGLEAPSEEAAPSQEGLEGAPSEEALAGIELPNLEDLSLTEPTTGAEESVEPPAGEPAEEFVPSPELPEPPAEEAAAPDQAVAPEPTAEPTVETEAAAEEGLGDLGLEDFSFAAPGGQFVPKEEPAAAQGPPPAGRAPREPAAEAGPTPELPTGEAEIGLTQEQFSQLRRALELLPRNLKMAVQDVIGDGRATGANLTKLVSLLVAGAGAQEIAAVVGRITGKRIAIPAGYEKRSGVAFEEERRTFAYAFRENIVPLIRLFALTILIAALVGFFGYRFVYRPLYALANYRIGYTHILGDRFTLANERFDKARAASHLKRWYYRYAEGFSDKRQYVLAEQKYDQLLRDFPGDRKGILDYSRMESTRLADYKKADDLLQLILVDKPYDYDALLAAGDNNLEWAGAVQLPESDKRFEAARVDYATLIERYGTRDEFLFRMLRYFIRKDVPVEIERLRLYFASRPQLRVDPAVYAELGGYLIDHRQLDHAGEVLFKAEEARADLPEIHYNLARYYRLTQRPDDEMLALNATVKLMRPSDPLTPKRISMEVDTHTRLGELYNEQGRYINGEKELTDAIARVEESQKNKLIQTGGIFGRPYADLGNLHYYIVGDLDVARTLYQKAEDNQYFDPSLDYKIGFTHYAQADYQGALASFAKTEDEWGDPRDPDAPPPFLPTAAAPIDYSGKPPVNLLFAIANCFYQRGDYFAAQGYYLRLRERLEARQAALGPLSPQEKPDHRSLLELLVKVDNNLGVVMDRLSRRTGDRTKRSEALVYLTDASQNADALTRSPDSRSSGGAKNLPYLNQRGILYPVAGFVPQIVSDIPKDLGTMFW